MGQVENLFDLMRSISKTSTSLNFLFRKSEIRSWGRVELEGRVEGRVRVGHL